METNQSVENLATAVETASLAILDAAGQAANQSGLTDITDQFFVTAHALIEVLAHITVEVTSQNAVGRHKKNVENKLFHTHCKELRRQLIRFRTAKREEIMHKESVGLK